MCDGRLQEMHYKLERASGLALCPVETLVAIAALASEFWSLSRHRGGVSPASRWCRRQHTFSRVDVGAGSMLPSGTGVAGQGPERPFPLSLIRGAARVGLRSLLVLGLAADECDSGEDEGCAGAGEGW
jgi:hypothetical protein